MGKTGDARLAATVNIKKEIVRYIAPVINRHFNDLQGTQKRMIMPEKGIFASELSTAGI